MACILSTNQAKGCLDSVGGVKKFWIVKNEDLDQGSTTFDADGSITLLVLVAAPSSLTPIFPYEVYSEVGIAEATSETNKDNGTTFWNHTATFPIGKMNQTTRNELKALAAMGATVIVEDNNGLYWVYGYSNGLTNAGIKSSTGKELGDANGYIVSLAGNEPEDAVEIDFAAFSALVNP